jgi:putative NADH-flavin reductase
MLWWEADLCEQIAAAGRLVIRFDNVASSSALSTAETAGSTLDDCLSYPDRLSGLPCMALRLFILGATGHVGTQAVDIALARGHTVTAFVRSPQKVVRNDVGLNVIRGDPLSVDELAHALLGHDAVISALGPSPREAFRPSTLLAECAASTVAAMNAARVRRLAIVSAAVLFPDRRWRFAFFRWLLKHHARDLLSMESVVQGTEFDWTIARPPRLVASGAETYRNEHDALPAKGWSMSYRAVAAFLIDCIEQRSHAREIVGLASARAA